MRRMFHRVPWVLITLAAIAFAGGGALWAIARPALGTVATGAWSGSVEHLFRPAAGAPRTVTILHTNDIHGHLSAFRVAPGNASAQTGDPGRRAQEYAREGLIGGFARLATAVQQIRAERGAEQVLLVDAGDTFGDQLLANLTRGEATLRLMDALRYDFMALGNHDFEYGSANTERLQRLVHFPMRAANARVKTTAASVRPGAVADLPPFLGDPTLVVTRAGVRVGLLALTYHNTDQTGNADNTRDLEFTSGIEAARRYVPLLRRRADMVVIVSHQGTVVDSILAERVPGIDIIVGGHSHDEIAPPRRVSGTWMVQALSDASAFGELTVTINQGRVEKVRGIVHALYADRYAPDSAFAARLDSLRAPHRAVLEEVIATAATDIGRTYKSESAADKLAGEILREFAGAEVSLLPGLGFGTTVRPGPVTREMILALFPHPTKVVRVTLTGAQILTTLEQSATNLRPADDMDRVGGLLQTSGLRWTVDLRRPAGARVSAVTIAGVALEPARAYRVVTNGGILQATHRYTVVAAGRNVERMPQNVSDVLVDAFRRRGVVRAPALGDITLIQADSRETRSH